MPILKNISPETNFAMLSNDILQDEILNYDSKGVLVELLSRPEDWKVYKEQLLRPHTRHVKLDRIFKELQKAGYLYIHTIRKDGKIFDRCWIVSSKPITKEEFKQEVEILGNLGSRKPRIKESSIQEDPGLQINNTKNKEKDKNKEEDITPLTTGINFDKLTEKERNSILTVFEFWNLHIYPGKWQPHIKLSFDIISAIQENLKNYTVEDICNAIALYARVLQDDRYYWDYVWPLSTFLTVKYERRKDSQKKWYQFLPENFVEKKYMNDSKSGVEKIEDPDPELTQKVIKAYSWLINNEKYSPTNGEMVKFIRTSKKMLEFYEDRGIIKTNWIKYLRKCLEKNYGNRGETLYPGHMCGEHTWGVLMPQFLAELGV